MKLSYCIPVCNEFVEIQRLVNNLKKNIKPEDQIIILYDEEHGDPEVENYLRSHSTDFTWYPIKLNNDFAGMKNEFLKYATGEFCIFIDADEILNDVCFPTIEEIIKLNPEIDVYNIARLNRVHGITEEYIKKWGWRIDEQGRINWRDPQQRIFKNNGKIKYKNKIHEVLYGYENIADLPDELHIIHFKTLTKQIKQNEFYSKI